MPPITVPVRLNVPPTHTFDGLTTAVMVGNLLTASELVYAANVPQPGTDAVTV